MSSLLAEKVRRTMKSTFAKSRGMLALVVAGSLLFVSGCASGPPKSGFLSDYSQLQLISDDAPVWDFMDASGAARSRSVLRVWANRPDLDEIAGYDGVIVDPFVLRLSKHSSGNWVNPAKLDELTKTLHAAFVDSISDCYTIVDEPGEGVARFRSALTDLSPLIVYHSAEDIAALTWANSRAGGGAFEVELVDSVTKEQIAAIVGKSRGGRFAALNPDKDPWYHAQIGAKNFGAFLCDRHKKAGASD